MAEHRQSFRFRLPWLAPERPAAQPQRRRPTTESAQAPLQPMAAVQTPFTLAAATQPLRQQSQLPTKAEPKSPQSSSPAPSPTAARSGNTSPSSMIAKPPSPSTTTAKSMPSLAATESTKTTFQSPPSPPSATTKPPSPPSAATETSKANSQSTSSSSGSTAKPPSPSRIVPQSPKVTSQSTSSLSRATTESPKSSPRPASTQPSAAPATAKLASPSRVANESPKATPKSASTQPSPSGAVVESRIGSKSASPSSQERTQSKVGSAAPSPPKGDSKSKTSSAPPSLSPPTSQAQPEPSKSSQPQSPSRLAPPKTTTSEVSSPPRKATEKEPEATASIVSQSPSSTQAQPIVAQEEPKKSTSQEPLQEREQKVENTSEAMKPPTSRDDAIAGERTDISSTKKGVPASKEVAMEPVQLQKPDLSVVGRDKKPMPEESKETAGKKEEGQELHKEEKKYKATGNEEESIQKTITETPSFRKDSKDIRVGESQATKRQPKQEASERKETLATTTYIGKQIKTVILSQPTEGNTGMSFQKPVVEAAVIQREIKEDISKLVNTLATGTLLDKSQVIVITLTGENRGASMLMSSEQAKKEVSIHIHRGYKTDPDDSSETTTDGEAHANRKRFDAQMAPQPKAFVNSNAQGVNNSIFIEASMRDRNPGVHLFLSQNTSEATKANGKSEFIQTHKAKFTAIPTERLTHEPIVRRRCLRGLFMESSESDLDNHDKPQRHGCRHSCGQKNKDKEFM